MQNVVDDIKDLITNKTADGKDYMGKKFTRYSASYAKKKGVGRGDVDLRASGAMLNSIMARVDSPKHGRVEVLNKPLIAQYHNQGGSKVRFLPGAKVIEGGQPPKREFMNISDSALGKLVKKHFDDVIMKILGRR